MIKKGATALAAAFAMSLGTTLGELARDAIKERFMPPPTPARRRKARR